MMATKIQEKEIAQIIASLESRSPQDQMKAEQQLEKAHSKRQFMPKLLQLAISQKQYEEDTIPLQAAIQFKNIIKAKWSATGESFMTSDRQQIIQNIIPSIFTSSQKSDLESSVVKQLMNAFKYIASHQFKLKCNELMMKQLASALESGTQNAVLAIKLIVKIAKTFEARNQNMKRPLDDVMKQLFPKVEEIIGVAIDNLNTEQGFHVIQQAVKLFASVNLIQVADYFSFNVQKYQNWLRLHERAIMGIDVPKEFSQETTDPQEIQQREQYEFFKLQGDAMKSIHYQFQHFANRKYCSRDFYPIQQSLCRIQWVWDMILNIIKQKRNYFIPSSLLLGALNFLSITYSNPQLKKFSQKIIQEIEENEGIDYIELTPVDCSLFANDQQQFERIHVDDSQFESVRKSMMSLLQQVCKPLNQTIQGKEGVKKVRANDGKIKTKKIVKINTKKLENYLLACFDLIQKNQIEEPKKQAAMFVIGNLFEYIQQLEGGFYNQIGQQLRQSIVPFLQSKIAILRYRASWVMSKFGDYEWEQSFQSKQKSEQIIGEISAYLCEILFKDPDMLARVQAATALASYYQYPPALKNLQNKFNVLLQILLELIKQIDHQGLMSSIQMLVYHAQEEIIPYAYVLTQKLTDYFQSIVQQTADTNNKEKSINAAGCLQSIKQILRSCKRSDSKHFRSLQELVFPIIGYSLSQMGQDYTQDGLQIFSLIISYAPELYKQHWDILPVLYMIVNGDQEDFGWGIDHFSKMLVIFQNFIQRDKKTLLYPTIFQNKQAPIDIIFALCNKIVENSYSLSDFDINYMVSCKIYLTILENLNGMIDEKLPLIGDLMIKHLFDLNNHIQQHPNASQPLVGIRSMILQVLCMMFAQNVQGMCCYLGQERLLQILKILFDFQSNFQHTFQIKRVLLGLTPLIFTQKFNSMPDQVYSNIPAIFKISVELIIKDVKAQIKQSPNAVKGFDIDTQAKLDEENGRLQASEFKSKQNWSSKKQSEGWRIFEISDDQDDDDDDDDDYAVEKKNMKGEIKKMVMDLDQDEIPDDHDDLIDYMSLYQSPLEKYNEVFEFKKAIQNCDEVKAEALMNSLSKQEQEQLSQAFCKAQMLVSSNE